jgi:gamma-glutamyltranspeptidase/glutathione hydrolase
MAGSAEVWFDLPMRPLHIPVILRCAAVLLLFAHAASVVRAQQAEPVEHSQPSVIPPSNWPAHAVRASHGMVVSDKSLASQTGITILKQGGNAVDAAVATAFALAVVEPEAGNIGGGGFMLVRMKDGRTSFVDYREEAPGKASREMYLAPDDLAVAGASTIGYRSVAVPGTVAGLDLALRTYGRLKLSEVLAPAIRLAQDGFPVSPRLAGLFREAHERLERFSVSRKIFLRDWEMYRPGEIFRQPELAATLRRIARGGSAEFYRGETAHILASEMAANGGLVTLGDLAAYRAKAREPLQATYEARGSKWELITSPPPSSGGIAAIEILNILAPIGLKGWDDAQSVHWVVEAMRRAFADRAAYLGDADFSNVPVAWLTDSRYAAQLRATIDPERATPSSAIHAGNPSAFDSAVPPASPSGADGRAARDPVALALAEATAQGHTTHFSVVDGAGNAVSNTFTLNDYFGSGVTSSAGFLLNDEMDDFTTAPGKPNMFGLLQSEANTIGPGRRPLSSMMPSILLRDGYLSFVSGSPGGSRIISATLLSILNWMRLGMDAQDAINAPRFHEQWMPEKVVYESIFPFGVRQELEQRGYSFSGPKWIGCVEAIGVDPHTGELLGAPDPRLGGAAASY